MPSVVPRFVREEGANWSLDGSTDTERVPDEWGWVGENSRGYVQFFVEPDLETVREEVDGEQEAERNEHAQEMEEMKETEEEPLGFQC